MGLGAQDGGRAGTEATQVRAAGRLCVASSGRANTCTSKSDQALEMQVLQPPILPMRTLRPREEKGGV